MKGINMMFKMGRPFDAAFLADQMGSPDIANMMRNQGIAGAFGAMGGNLSEAPPIRDQILEDTLVVLWNERFRRIEDLIPLVRARTRNDNYTEEQIRSAFNRLQAEGKLPPPPRQPRRRRQVPLQTPQAASQPPQMPPQLPQALPVSEVSSPAGGLQPPPGLPGSGVQPPPTPPAGAPDPAVLYEFIQPHLARGTTYTALATLVGRQLGHLYTALLEQIATEVEGYRTGNLTLPQQYPLVAAAHAHRLGAYVLALNRLPLTENRTYTPTWKSEILSSKVAPGGETGGQTGGATVGQPGALSVSNQVSPDLSDDFNPTYEDLEFLNMVTSQSGGNLSQPTGSHPILRDERPFKNRWDDWQKGINTLIKMGKPYDAAFLAEQMGSPDIAAIVRCRE